MLPEDLYPWLNLASGLLVVGVGAAVLRARSQRHEAQRTRTTITTTTSITTTTRTRIPTAGTPTPTTSLTGSAPKGIVAMGASAGLIPCPSALVVLLGAIAQHQVALGLLLIVAFSLGLAVHADRARPARGRRPGADLAPRSNVSGRLATALPAVSALIIIGAGIVLTAQAVPQLGG